MRDYVVFYLTSRVEVKASSSYEAQQKGVEHFQKEFPRRKIKGYQVHPYLADVVHVAVD